MSQLNMKELYSTINEKTLKRMEIYDDVLKKCHLRIKYNSTLERTYCFYQIPEFIIGVPLYDTNGDGIVNILDVILVVNFILGIGDIDCSIDYDNDDSINVIDLVIMVNIILDGE